MKKIITVLAFAFLATTVTAPLAMAGAAEKKAAKSTAHKSQTNKDCCCCDAKKMSGDEKAKCNTMGSQKESKKGSEKK